MDMSRTTAPTAEMPDIKTPPVIKSSVSVAGTDIKEIIEKKKIDVSVLNDKYSLEHVIYSGNMSTVFLGKSVKLGNQWIIKYIEKDKGYLANEEDILKRLNHINLPSIIDIFHNDSGIFIVESYIEGVSLEKVLENGIKVNVATIMGWMEELSQLLNYLHSLNPHPIVHCDLKPSNIMITHDDKLVLIDFGISKRIGEDSEKSAALTYRYAAPEQFGKEIGEKHRELVTERFGKLPDERFSWKIDSRTDIYSFGVIFFELLTGDIPKKSNYETLKSNVSNQLADIIYACVQTADILCDLTNVKNKRLHMVRSLAKRKFASFSTAFLFSVSSATIGSGAYIMQNENLALVAMSPSLAVISEQRETEIRIQKTYPNGRVQILDSNMITWSQPADNIARIDGNRIVGINEGQTEIFGRHRNKVISVMVNVVQPMDGMVGISLDYQMGNTVALFAGGGIGSDRDGPLLEASFASPASIDIDDEGNIYLVDGDRIRFISNDSVSTISLPPRTTPDKLRAYDGMLFILTSKRSDDGVYEIIRREIENYETVYTGDGRFTGIDDFIIFNDILYFIQNQTIGNHRYLISIDLTTGYPYEPYRHIRLSPGMRAMSMCVDDNGSIYIADSERAVIEKFNPETSDLSFVAGIEGERHFIDGTAPLMYRPQRIRITNNILYVFDFNVLRMINLRGGIIGNAETIAGQVSTERNPATVPGDAWNITFARSMLTDFVAADGLILLTDPVKGVVWEIK
jgi:serine/threonine protein kinase